MQILTPAPDNLLAKRLAEKESMTSISVGNGLDTPAGMKCASSLPAAGPDASDTVKHDCGCFSPH